MKLKRSNLKYKVGRGVVWFICPGCKIHHEVTTEGPEPKWIFNNDFDRPTLSPSVKVSFEEFVCHFFVNEGKIQFLADCTHELKGQTVPLPEMREDQ